MPNDIMTEYEELFDYLKAKVLGSGSFQLSFHNWHWEVGVMARHRMPQERWEQIWGPAYKPRPMVGTCDEWEWALDKKESPKEKKMLMRDKEKMLVYFKMGEYDIDPKREEWSRDGKEDEDYHEFVYRRAQEMVEPFLRRKRARDPTEDLRLPHKRLKFADEDSVPAADLL